MNDVQGRERRMVKRVSGETIRPILLRAMASGPSSNAEVVDISIQGVGLLSDNSLAPGTQVWIRPEDTGARVLELPAEVVHVNPAPAERWHLGCRFNRALRMDDVLALG